MHQNKAVAQIILILSVFNLVFAIPVEREIYNARGDAVVPVVLRDVATTNEPRSDLDGLPSQSSSPPPEPSHSSPLMPDRLPSDGPASSHEIELASPGETASSSAVPALDHWRPDAPSTSQHPSAPPPSPDGSMVSHGSSPADGPTSEHGWSSPPGGPAGLAVSSPPGETSSRPLVPALDHSDSTSTSEHSLGHYVVEPDPPRPETAMSKFAGKATKALDIAIFTSILVGGIYWLNHLNQHHQSTRNYPDCSTAKESRNSNLD